MESSKDEAVKDKVVVPQTVEEYVLKTKPKPAEMDCSELDLDEDYYGWDESGIIKPLLVF